MEHQDITSKLGNLRVKYPNKGVIVHLNINSVRNKFEVPMFCGKIDILLINDTKLVAYSLHHKLLWMVTRTIVIRNGKIVWKYGPDWPFYAFMLRTKLY